MKYKIIFNSMLPGESFTCENISQEDLDKIAQVLERQRGWLDITENGNIKASVNLNNIIDIQYEIIKDTNGI